MCIHPRAGVSEQTLSWDSTCTKEAASVEASGRTEADVFLCFRTINTLLEHVARVRAMKIPGSGDAWTSPSLATRLGRGAPRLNSFVQS